MIPFTNAKSSDSDTHEWINEILFCCSFSRMPRHLIVTCMNLSMASMFDKNSFFGLGDPRIGVVVVGSSNSLCIPQLAFNTCDLEPWSSSIASCVRCCRLRRIGHSMDLGGVLLVSGVSCVFMFVCCGMAVCHFHNLLPVPTFHKPIPSSFASAGLLLSVWFLRCEKKAVVIQTSTCFGVFFVTWLSADILIIFLTFALVGFCWFGVGSDFANLIGESKGSHSSSSSSSSSGSSKGSSSSKFQSSKFQSSSFQSSSFQSSSFQSFNLQSSKFPRNSPKVKNSTRGASGHLPILRLRA